MAKRAGTPFSGSESAILADQAHAAGALCHQQAAIGQEGHARRFDEPLGKVSTLTAAGFLRVAPCYFGGGGPAAGEDSAEQSAGRGSKTRIISLRPPVSLGFMAGFVVTTFKDGGLLIFPR